MRRVPRPVRVALLFATWALPSALLWWAFESGVRADDVSLWLATWRRSWFALPLVMLSFVLLALLPVTMLVGVTGVAFGPVLGPIYAMAGCLASASAAFAAGRWLARHGHATSRWPRRLRVTAAMARNGTLTVFLIRKVPAPFALVNAALGASAIRYRDFVTGTALGMTALVLALAGFGGQLVEAWRDPSPAAAARAAGLLALPITAAWAINRWLRGRAREGHVAA